MAAVTAAVQVALQLHMALHRLLQPAPLVEFPVSAARVGLLMLLQCQQAATLMSMDTSM